MGIAISKYSQHPHEVAELIHYLLSPHTLKQRLIFSSMIPVKTSMLKDSELLKDTALSGWLGQHLQEGMFYRPPPLPAIGMKPFLPPIPRPFTKS